MGLLETKCKRRAVIGVKPDHDLPERSIVYNAPRPIYGQVQWTGDFISGVFYTMTDPAHTEAENWDELNRQNDATVLVYFTKDEALAKTIAYYINTYGVEQYHELEAIYSVEELRKEMVDQFHRLTRDGEIEI